MLPGAELGQALVRAQAKRGSLRRAAGRQRVGRVPSQLLRCVRRRRLRHAEHHNVDDARNVHDVPTALRSRREWELWRHLFANAERSVRAGLAERTVRLRSRSVRSLRWHRFLPRDVSGPGDLHPVCGLWGVRLCDPVHRRERSLVQRHLSSQIRVRSRRARLGVPVPPVKLGRPSLGSPGAFTSRGAEWASCSRPTGRPAQVVLPPSLGPGPALPGPRSLRAPVSLEEPSFSRPVKVALTLVLLAYMALLVETIRVARMVNSMMGTVEDF